MSQMLEKNLVFSLSFEKKKSIKYYIFSLLLPLNYLPLLSQYTVLALPIFKSMRKQSFQFFFAIWNIHYLEFFH